MTPGGLISVADAVTTVSVVSVFLNNTTEFPVKDSLVGGTTLVMLKPTTGGTTATARKAITTRVTGKAVSVLTWTILATQTSRPMMAANAYQATVTPDL